MEAKTWVKKYFNEDSVAIKFLLSIMRGINDNKLISKPIHIPIQEEDEIVRIVLHNKVIIKINLEIKLIIKKKRTITFIDGVWTQKLY